MSRDYTPSDLEDSRDAEPSTPGGASDRQMERPDRTHSSACHSRVDNHASPSPDAHTIPARCHDSRSAYYTRSRAYRIRGSEIQTLAELGKFRAVGTADLARHAYRGQREDMQEDIRNLARQGLIRKKTCEGPDANSRELLTLTNEGSKLLRANHFLPEDQAAYYGFVKPKEANHDADIYRLYQKGIINILDQSGRNPRVVLDFELKKNLNRDFARFGTESRNEIAARYGLEVVRGKVPFPTFVSNTRAKTAKPPVSTWNLNRALPARTACRQGTSWILTLCLTR
jgi:DNA-binding MarR family transcriptional regulator